jgi:undecaprenyl phosphate-alpha-L-ara4N flippase subunit ArnE
LPCAAILAGVFRLILSTGPLSGCPIVMAYEVLPARTLLFLLLMVSMTSTGNVLIKLGSILPASERSLFGLMSYKTALGITIFAGSVLLYAKVLETLPLNVAQAFAALQFIFVILASFVLLGETISWLRWLGIILIAAGILIVGLTAGFPTAVGAAAPGPLQPH